MKKLTDLDHLLAIFGTCDCLEKLEAELDIAAEHHRELAGYLRTQLAAGAYEHLHSLITPAGAAQPATIHDTNAAESTAMAATIHTALNPDLDLDEGDDQ